ncbi:MAG: CheR family methyltransferase [Pseudomonadota bacterium]
MLQQPGKISAESGLSEETANELRSLLRSSAGITLSPEKDGLLRMRLQRRCRELGLPSIESYHRHLVRDTSGEELRQFVEAMTIHTTSFFRERGHYTWLVEHGLDKLSTEGAGTKRPLVVWSAACSSGQEAYSAAIALALAADRRRDLTFRIIGTDISRKVLGKAQAAIYSREEISGLSPEICRRFLLRAKPGREECYRIVPELREMTTWRQGNLTDPRRGMDFTADVAFIRNVLIYFDEPTVARAIDTVIDRVRLGGVIFAGHSEVLRDPKGRLTLLAPSIYLKERNQ